MEPHMAVNVGDICGFEVILRMHEIHAGLGAQAGMGFAGDCGVKDTEANPGV